MFYLWLVLFYNIVVESVINGNNLTSYDLKGNTKVNKYQLTD